MKEARNWEWGKYGKAIDEIKLETFFNEIYYESRDLALCAATGQYTYLHCADIIDNKSL